MNVLATARLVTAQWVQVGSSRHDPLEQPHIWSAPHFVVELPRFREHLRPARCWHSSPLPCGGHLVFRRLCDWEDLAHILGQGLAKALGIGRHLAPLVPLNHKSLLKRLAPVCDADDSQRVAICSQKRGNDRDPLPGLSEREQGMRRAALEQNIGLNVCETADCVEQPPNGVTRLDVLR